MSSWSKITPTFKGMSAACVYSGAAGIFFDAAQPDTAKTIDKRNNDTSVFMSSPPKSCGVSYQHSIKVITSGLQMTYNLLDRSFSECLPCATYYGSI